MDRNRETRESPIQAELSRGGFIGGSELQPAPIEPATQRIIINFFKTSNPRNLALADAPIFQSDKAKFAKFITDGRVRPDHSFAKYNKYNFLELVPAPIDKPSARDFIADQLAGEANSTPSFSDQRILLKYLFSDQTQHFSGQRLADLLRENPTPEYINDIFASEITRRFSDYPAKQIELFRSAEQLLNRMYGRRQTVYTQFRLLVNQAFVNEPESDSSSKTEDLNIGADQNEPRPSRFSAFTSQGREQRRAEKAALMPAEITSLKQELEQKNRLLSDALKTSQTLIKQNEELQRQLAKAQSEITDIKSGKGESNLDPDGRFALLGLDPRFYASLPVAEYVAFLENHRKTVLKVLHPDIRSGVEDPRIKNMNDALDKLIAMRKPKETTYST